MFLVYQKRRVLAPQWLGCVLCSWNSVTGTGFLVLVRILRCECMWSFFGPERVLGSIVLDWIWTVAAWVVSVEVICLSVSVVVQCVAKKIFGSFFGKGFLYFLGVFGGFDGVCLKILNHVRCDNFFGFLGNFIILGGFLFLVRDRGGCLDCVFCGFVSVLV